MFKNIQKRWYLGAMVVLAFASFICGANIDSAYADSHKLNGFLLGCTIGCGIGALLFLYLASKTPKV